VEDVLVEGRSASDSEVVIDAVEFLDLDDVVVHIHRLFGGGIAVSCGCLQEAAQDHDGAQEDADLAREGVVDPGLENRVDQAVIFDAKRSDQSTENKLTLNPLSSELGL